MSTVYLLHFSEPYPAGRRPQHYVGVARELDERIASHRRGNPGKGGSLTRAIKQKGITFEVVEEWHFATPDEAFAFERRLKRQRHHARHCRVCKEKALAEEKALAKFAVGFAFSLCDTKTRAEKRRCRKGKP